MALDKYQVSSICVLYIRSQFYLVFRFNEKQSGTGSLPVLDQGWQRNILAKPIKTPLSPCFSIA